MTVNITKPAINLRSELADLRKPTGIAGEAMMRAETPQEQFQLIGAGRRNILINGGFDVWQRGTSFADISSTYCADRWGHYFSSTSHITVTRQSFPTGHTEVEGNPKYYLRMDNTPDADATWMEFYQRIEDVNQFSGATVTVSFWIKASSAQSNNDRLYFIMNHGSGGSSQLSAVSDFLDISTTWEKKVVTVTLPSLYGRAVGAGSYMELRMYQTALVAADTQYDIAQVQLELGKVATPFEHRSYGEELALCQRYYERRGTNINGWEFISDAGQLASATTYQCAVRFNEQMRAAPTMTLTGTLSNLKVIRASNLVTVTSMTASDNTNGKTMLLSGGCAASGGSAGEQTRMQTTVAGTFVNFDAEL